MSGYAAWDRDAYIDRVGGEDEAERRRKALMARQSGHRPTDEAQASEADVDPARSTSRASRRDRSHGSSVAFTLDSSYGVPTRWRTSAEDHTLTVTTTVVRSARHQGSVWRALATVDDLHVLALPCATVSSWP